MKITLGEATYLIHWETRKFSPKEGKNTELELKATDCIIRRVIADGDPVELIRGHVSQTSCDPANAVTARRLSFIKAIKGLPRYLSKVLGHEYNRTCRVTSGVTSQKNRRLKARITELEKAVDEAKIKQGQFRTIIEELLVPTNFISIEAARNYIIEALEKSGLAEAVPTTT